MANEKKTTITLELSDDHPRWAEDIEALLMIDNCNGAILPEVNYSHKFFLEHFVRKGAKKKIFPRTLS